MDEQDLKLLNDLLDAKDPRAAQILRKMTGDEASQFMVFRQQQMNPQHLIDLVPEDEGMDEISQQLVTAVMGGGGLALRGGAPPIGPASNIIRGGPATHARAPRKPGMIGNIEGGPIDWHEVKGPGTVNPPNPPNLIREPGGTGRLNLDETDKRSIMFGGIGDRSRPQSRTPVSKASVDPEPYKPTQRRRPKK